MAASLAMPALAILYLLKLRRRPIRVSSTVLWEQAAADLQVNMPLRWLKWSLLLLLHVLIVGLICLALGRPAIGDAGISAKRVVLVIDRSASMSAADGVGVDGKNAARFEQAKQEATRLIAELGRGMGGVSAALVTFAAEPRAVVGMTSDLRLVRDEVAKLEATDQPGDLQAAMKLVVSMVSPEGAEAGGTADDAMVVIIGDGAYETEAPISAGNAEIRFVRCGPAIAPGTLGGSPNIGVTAISARRDDAQPSRLRVFARVVNAAGQPKSVPVTLAVNGVVMERRAATVPAATAQEPGGAGVTFDVVMSEAGIVTVAGPGGDVLASDDSASIVVAAALRPAVLFVTPGTGGSGITPEGLLGDVLAELPLQKLDRVTPAQLEEKVRDGSLTGYDLLVLDRADLRVLPSMPTLALGSSLPSVGLTLTARGEAAAEAAGYALTWKRTHPVLRDVAMDSVYVGRWRAFSDAPVEAASTAKLEELARGRDGPLMRVSEDGGVRRLATAFDIEQSNWALEPGFAIFLSSAVEYLTGRNAESAAVSFSTASRIEILGPETQPPATKVELKGPVTVEAGLAAGTRRVMVGPMERAGVYTTTGTPAAVAVNVADERESSVRSVETLEVAGRSVSAGAGGGGPSEIWPWVVMAAGGLLIVEWLAYGLKSRV